jgi:hypothetical protein
MVDAYLRPCPGRLCESFPGAATREVGEQESSVLANIRSNGGPAGFGRGPPGCHDQIGNRQDNSPG